MQEVRAQKTEYLAWIRALRWGEEPVRVMALIAGDKSDNTIRESMQDSLDSAEIKVDKTIPETKSHTCLRVFSALQSSLN